MALIPLRDSFLFSFLNDTVDGLFVERNKAGFILTNKDMDSQGKFARWGKVLAIGPKVTDFKIGDLVLIESGMWTVGFKYEGAKIWKSDQTKVCGIGADESVTYAY